MMLNFSRFDHLAIAIVLTLQIAPSHASVQIKPPQSAVPLSQATSDQISADLIHGCGVEARRTFSYMARILAKEYRPFTTTTGLTPEEIRMTDYNGDTRHDAKAAVLRIVLLARIQQRTALEATVAKLSAFLSVTTLPEVNSLFSLCLVKRRLAQLDSNQIPPRIAAPGSEKNRGAPSPTNSGDVVQAPSRPPRSTATACLQSENSVESMILGTNTCDRPIKIYTGCSNSDCIGNQEYQIRNGEWVITFNPRLKGYYVTVCWEDEILENENGVDRSVATCVAKPRQ